MFKLIDFWSPGKAGSWNPRTGRLGLGGIEQENWDSCCGSMGNRRRMRVRMRVRLGD